MNISAVAFRNNFLRIYQRSGFKSYRSLSKAAGVSQSRVQKIATGEFDESLVGPGIFTVNRIAEALRSSPNELLGIHSDSDIQSFEEQGTPRGVPTIKRLMACYGDSGGAIEGFKKYLNFCQLYAEPRDRKVKLLWSGSLSLAARKLQTNEVSKLQAVYDDGSDETKEMIYAGQRRAWDAGCGVEPCYPNQKIPKLSKHARFGFIRSAFRVRRPDESECLLIYCELIDQ